MVARPRLDSFELFGEKKEIKQIYEFTNYFELSNLKGGVRMTKRKLNLAKVVWLVFLCLGITFFSVNNSQALPITVNNIISDYPTAGTGYLTQYWLDTEEFGLLDAFCVEEVNALPVGGFELFPAPISGLLGDAAGIASLYFAGSVFALPNITTQEEAKVATQLAIWQWLGIVSTSDSFYAPLVSEILALDFSSISDSIYLAQSPLTGLPGGSPGISQDYLVSVPDASIMFLLGSALLGLGLFGRKRKSDV